MSSAARGTGWTLVLLRHAKSSWVEDVPDHMRPLAGRGRRDAPGAGRWLRTAGCVPGLVLCSTARRTRQTWQLAEAGLLEAGESGEPGLAAPPVSYERQIYGAAVADLLDLLQRQPASVRTLLVVGHEPGMSELTLTLAGAAGEATAGSDLARLAAKFPTAAIAVLSSAGDWSQLGPGRAQLVSFVTPRDLRAGGGKRDG
ncbi:MAG TPA: histidine phosphatase family protein [Streptosporangiaceae bacterium]